VEDRHRSWQNQGNAVTHRELVEFVARSLVDRPDEVFVRETESEDGIVLELRVAQGDVGAVIGRQGRIVNSLRTVLAVAGAREGRRIALEVVAPEGPGGPPDAGRRGPRRGPR
jgi:predicted RNA-binding protein YlqC (UPF0109 family)